MVTRYVRPATVVAGFALAAALAGCAGLGAGYEPGMAEPTLIAPERSMVVLPNELAQQRLAVRRQVDHGRLIERTVLGNRTAMPGENAIEVQGRSRGTSFAALFSGPLRNPFTEARIDARIAGEFDGWPEVSPLLERANRHGAYRYVEAANGEVRCVLAWQMVSAWGPLTGEADSYALDFRYCDPQLDPDALLAWFDQLRVAPQL